VDDTTFCVFGGTPKPSKNTQIIEEEQDLYLVENSRIRIGGIPTWRKKEKMNFGILGWRKVSTFSPKQNHASARRSFMDQRNLQV
jgi:hypothetical protein